MKDKEFEKVDNCQFSIVGDSDSDEPKIIIESPAPTPEDIENLNLVGSLFDDSIQQSFRNKKLSFVQREINEEVLKDILDEFG